MDTTTQEHASLSRAEAPPDRARIVATPGTCGGKPRIEGHRITVADVAIWHERMGMSPNQIVAEYPTINLSKVYAALAYYFENREFVDSQILEGEQFADRLLAGQPSIFEKVRPMRMATHGEADPLSPG